VSSPKNNRKRQLRTPRRGGAREAIFRLARERKKELLAAALLGLIVTGSVFVYYYVQFSRMVDERLSGKIFRTASLVLSAPTPVFPGEKIAPAALEDRLRKALYSESGKGDTETGSFELQVGRLSINPGPESAFRTGPYQEGPAIITFQGGKIASITDPAQKTALDHYDLEPEVITTLFDQKRSKRLLVTFSDLPPALVNAVLAAEDRRFFSHPGVNVFRLVEATITDVLADARLQGGSTLTMQLARNFFLTPRRTIRRKLKEIFIALLLERRLSKEEIFTLYANQVYMGQRGSFSIYGFGEAADAYFNKSVKDLTLPEAALLAGMIRGPNLYSPYRYQERARQRRNWVLGMMAENNFITRDQAQQAMAAPMNITQRNVGGTQAPYFVDVVKDELAGHFPEQDLLSHSYRVYTTLDPDLQNAASEAVRAGMQEVDQRLKGRRRKPQGPGEPQAALVVLDPHSGEVRALVGGRDYAVSQLNHALALRQPGSSFKPFVYATALSSAVDGSQPLITSSTVLPDQPMTFQFENQTYEPKDYKDEYYGMATVREALALSLNVATVNLAQMAGYGKIRDLALAAGIDNGIQATPAIALGAYVAMPLQIAGGYTIFANSGVYEAPRCILAVKDQSGRTLWQNPGIARRVLDPRVAYLMVSLMQSVIEHGTGEGVRARGFMAPAAGKTGTSRDGWFAGFTSNLLAVAWVGYDNDQNLGLAGASSALPVWTAFMKSASQLPAYRNMQQFPQPLGVIAAPIDSKTLQLTASNPLASSQDVYIDGTQPVSPNAASRLTSWIGKLLPFGKHQNAATQPDAAPPRAIPEPSAGVSQQKAQQPSASAGDQGSQTAQAKSAPLGNKPQGLLKKFLSIFKHHKPKP